MAASPYNKREDKNAKKAFSDTEKGIKPVAKDTNKTRRKETKSRIVGETEKKSMPSSNLKGDMKKKINTTK
jgi:hypothetical protein